MIDVNEIMSFLPHRYPFLFVDRIIELQEGKRIVGIKNVTINEPFFQGHFPGEPVMPGVLIIEAMGQTAGVLAYKAMGKEAEGKAVYLMSINRVKFRRPVVPGDQLRLELDVVRHKGFIWAFKGKAFVEDQVVAEAELMATIMEKEVGGG
ncbi:MAG: 3-hydroxyacyl-[acyl-carrier-protein] dehydratase FabZ [Deltaproteobacteria bacterium]|nr:MAG: 3-hydroxyacyl-[acyl-carrier-protein] dehydratase FabZ [Deltaproteobacteria bacterium]